MGKETVIQQVKNYFLYKRPSAQVTIKEQDKIYKERSAVELRQVDGAYQLILKGLGPNYPELNMGTIEDVAFLSGKSQANIILDDDKQVTIKTEYKPLQRRLEVLANNYEMKPSQRQFFI